MKKKNGSIKLVQNPTIDYLPNFFDIQKMKKSNSYFPILLFFTLAVGIVLGGLLNFPKNEPLFQKTIRKINSTK
jgi:hypothetical protein